MKIPQVSNRLFHLVKAAGTAEDGETAGADGQKVARDADARL